jgi:hypothetical protein
MYLKYFYPQDIIDDRLDTRQFPSVGGQRNPATSYAVQRYLSLALKPFLSISKNNRSSSS